MGETALVVKTGPITFATDLVGWYAVQINANDVACMGARPRWFLATVLLPEGADPSGQLLPQLGVAGELARVGVKAAVLGVVDAGPKVGKHDLGGALEALADGIRRVLYAGGVSRRSGP